MAQTKIIIESFLDNGNDTLQSGKQSIGFMKNVIVREIGDRGEKANLGNMEMYAPIEIYTMLLSFEEALLMKSATADKYDLSNLGSHIPIWERKPLIITNNL
jgi:hypothetical protein